MFVTTFGLGVAYYIPLHAATVTLAPEHAGFCNSSLDGIGYVFAIVFQVTASLVLDTAAKWKGVWLVQDLTLVRHLNMIRFCGAYGASICQHIYTCIIAEEDAALLSSGE